MTTENLYDALEICLNALEQGADIESCLVRFPTLADELRPILETAVQARASAVEDVPMDVMRRGKARVLQAAAEMRERDQRKPLVLPFWGRRSSSARTFRLVFTVLAVIVFLLSGGTGLVNASSGALPGDNLYSVKRTWENIRLLFTFNEHSREKLEVEFDQEREREIGELFDEGRLEKINFQGVVQSQQGEIWLVDGIKIKLSDDAIVSDGVVPGAVVQVIGETDDGLIEAEQIILIKSLAATFTPIPSTVRPVIRPTETPRPEKVEAESPEAETSSETSETPESSEPPQPGSTEMEDSGDDDETKTPEPIKTIEPTRTPKPSNSGSDNKNDSNDNGGNDNNSGSGDGDNDGGSDDNGGGDDNSGSGGGDDD